jgi:hypothetical protein
MGDGSLQSHSGASLNLKMEKDRGNVPKGGEAGGVALTAPSRLCSRCPPWGCQCMEPEEAGDLVEVCPQGWRASPRWKVLPLEQ